MPYEVRKEGEKWCVFNKDSGDKKACHDTEEDAQRQMRLLEAIEHDPGWGPRNA